MLHGAPINKWYFDQLVKVTSKPQKLSKKIREIDLMGNTEKGGAIPISSAQKVQSKHVRVVLSSLW